VHILGALPSIKPPHILGPADFFLHGCPPHLPHLLPSSSWCTQNDCGVDWCSSKEVLDVATTIKSTGLQAVGYDHILLDDCWGLRNATTKQIIGDSARFPEGMPAFIAKIHALGFKFGLYTDIGPDGCHHPFAGSYGHYKDDAKTFQDWAVDYVKFDGEFIPLLKSL
jgi:alpha-galactosidase